MVLKLYKTTDDPSVVDKTLTNEKSFDNVTIHDTAQILAPILIVTTSENLSSYNYAYIERYNRYYYMTVEAGTNGLWRLHLKVDVLKTYKESIKQLTGTIDRQEKTFNGYLNDDGYKALAYKEFVTKEFPNAMTNDSFIFMTVGQKGVYYDY